MSTDPLVGSDAELCRRNLVRFAKSAWPHCDSTPLLWNWHLDYMADIFTALHLREVKRAVITLPPRYGKSFLSQMAFPAWVWAREPGAKFVYCSHSEDLSIDFSVKRRNLIQSDWYQQRFPYIQMSPDKNEKWYYTNTQRGQIQAIGADTKVVGWGGDYLGLDDILDSNERKNKNTLRKLNDFLDNVWSSRLNDKVNGVMWLVMQRLSPYDPAGHLIDQGWTHFNLQAEAEKKVTIVFPHSGQVVEREEGDVLWPEREPAELLESIKTDKPEFWFTQYQQRPTSIGGSIVKREHIQYWTELPKKFDQWLQTWDLTLTDTSRADFVVGQVWGRIGPHKYLVYQARKRANLQASCDMIMHARRLYPLATATHIERKANGFEAIRRLSMKISGVIPYNPDRDKRSRLQAVQDEFESGCVFIPHPSKFPWVLAYVERLCSFDGDGTVDFDDEIDCTTCALGKMRTAVTASYSGPEGIGTALFKGESRIGKQFGVSTFGNPMVHRMGSHGRNPFSR